MDENSLKSAILLYAQDFGKQKIRKRGVYLDDGKPRVYVMYCRKSTDEKGRQEKSLEDQIKECQKLALDKQLAVSNIDGPFQEKKAQKDPEIDPCLAK